MHAPLRSMGPGTTSGQVVGALDIDGGTPQSPNESRKRKRQDEGTDEKVARLRQLLPFERGNLYHLDPIDNGLCDSSTAQDLFAL